MGTQVKDRPCWQVSLRAHISSGLTLWILNYLISSKQKILSFRFDDALYYCIKDPYKDDRGTRGTA